MTVDQEIRRFIATGEYDPVHATWPGRDFLEMARAGDSGLRCALIDEIRRRTAGCAPPCLPASFAPAPFVLGKVGPMVRGLFPARERHVVLDLFGKSLVFVTHENVEHLVTEAPYLSIAWTLANLCLGSLGLAGLGDQPAGLVGYSEEMTIYVSQAYFGDDDPFADWVVHEAAHVFHNWKRDRAGLPHTRTREFPLEIAYAKRELFAYACEAYDRILERATSPADRRRLHAEYAAQSVPADDRVDRDQLIDILADAVDARNGWKRILLRCAPPKPSLVAARASVR